MPSLLKKRSAVKNGASSNNNKLGAGISSSDLVRVGTHEDDARLLTTSAASTMISLRGRNGSGAALASSSASANESSTGTNGHANGGSSSRVLPTVIIPDSTHGGQVLQENEPMETLHAGTPTYVEHRGKEKDFSQYLASAGLRRVPSNASQSTLRLDQTNRDQHPSASQTTIRSSSEISRSLSKRLLTPLGGSALRELRPKASFTRTIAGGKYDGSDTKSSVGSEFTLLSPSGHATTGTTTYGYTPVGLDLQLEPAQVTQVVKACGEQIGLRGLDTPLIFSSMAIDLSPTETASLLRSFLGVTLGPSGQPSSAGSAPAPGTPLAKGFLQEIRFANPNDLAAVIKWCLARIGKVLAVPIPISEPNRKGDVQEEIAYVQQRGFLDLDAYLGWKDEERQNRYPAVAFQRFLKFLERDQQDLLTSLFTLLSSTTSYSHKNGMTPSRLARLFGPLLFGLREDETFERTYEAYCRASNATEHLFLAFIRYQASQQPLPTRLMEHVTGYPSMLSPEIGKLEQHARSMPVTVIEANVRMYSPDLLQTACQMDIATHCEEWEACKGDDEKHGLFPQFSDKYRKLINYRGGIQGTKPKYAPLSPRLSEASPRSPIDSDIDLHSSLASKEWGDFASIGFLETDQSKLAFNLKESERKARAERRGTKLWSEFESSGFAQEDDQGLESVLSFDEEIKAELDRWPNDRAAIMERLRKATQKLPDFPYDTKARVVASPSLGASSSSKQWSTIDETFAEVWADYMLGCGWTNRDELTHRSASFIVVQYKSRPTPWSVSAHSNVAGHVLPTSIVSPARSDFGERIEQDARSDAAWFVISEVVPTAYRAALEAYGRKAGKSRSALKKFNLFKKLGKSKDEHSSHAYDPHDVFQPGWGGATKRINLIDPVQKTLDSDRITYATMSNAASSPPYATRPLPADQSSTQASRRSLAAPPSLLGSQAPTSLLDSRASEPVAPRKASSSFMTALRSRSQRARHRKPVPPLSPPPPELPSKAGLMSAQLPPRQESFNSDDFETRSLYEPSPGKSANHRGHAHKVSRDDHWIDVMLKGSRNGTQDPDHEDVQASPKRKKPVTPEPLANKPLVAELVASKAPMTSPRRKAPPAPTEEPDVLLLGPALARDTLLLEPKDARPLSELSESPQLAYLREEEQQPQVQHVNADASAERDRPDNTQTSEAPADDSITSIQSDKKRPEPLQPVDVGNDTSSLNSPAATLRAGLNRMEVPVKPSPPTNTVVLPRENPFDKQRLHNRVAKIADKFGGKASGEKEKEEFGGKASGEKERQSSGSEPPTPIEKSPQEADGVAAIPPAVSEEISDSRAANSSAEIAHSSEALDVLTPMALALREPYQPGQPLHSLIEADELESVRSGSTNSRSVR